MKNFNQFWFSANKSFPRFLTISLNENFERAQRRTRIENYFQRLFSQKRRCKWITTVIKINDQHQAIIVSRQMCLTSSETPGTCKGKKKLIFLHFFSFSSRQKFTRHSGSIDSRRQKINLFIVRRGGLRDECGERRDKDAQWWIFRHFPSAISSSIIFLRANAHRLSHRLRSFRADAAEAMTEWGKERRRETEREQIAIPAVTRPATAAQTTTEAAADMYFEWKIFGKYSSKNRILRSRMRPPPLSFANIYLKMYLKYH